MKTLERCKQEGGKWVDSVYGQNQSLKVKNGIILRMHVFQDKWFKYSALFQVNSRLFLFSLISLGTFCKTDGLNGPQHQYSKFPAQL